MKTLFLSLAVVILQVVAFAQQKPCECTGQSKATIYSGGDKEPLTFYSLERLVTPGSAQSDPIHCYERNVRNHSVRDVTDVLWEVAGYYRSLLPSQKAICDATAILGHLAQPNPDGPLSYGIGPGSYRTTVYAPSQGWSPKKVSALAVPKLAPPLESSIQIATGYGVSTLRFQSAVENKGDVNFFHFQITNDGKEDLRVFWNIPLTADFKTMEMFPQSPKLVGPKGWSHDVRSGDPPAWIAATVVVFDKDGKKKIAQGVASAYCSTRGEVLELSPETFKGKY